jgi:hypothetical protein
MNKAQALQTLRPEAQWVLRGDELEWLDTEQVQPTEEEIRAEIARLEAEYIATQYQRDRKAEYDKLNQFEMQFDDVANGTTTWVDAINAIKAKYPKP